MHINLNVSTVGCCGMRPRGMSNPRPASVLYFLFFNIFIIIIFLVFVLRKAHHYSPLRLCLHKPYNSDDEHATHLRFIRERKRQKKKRTLAFVKVNSTSGCTELMEPEKYRSHFGHQKDMPFLLALNRILFIFQDGRVYYRRGLMSLQRRRPRPPKKKRNKRRIET